jgi:hypothetical protein
MCDRLSATDSVDTRPSAHDLDSAALCARLADGVTDLESRVDIALLRAQALRQAAAIRATKTALLDKVLDRLTDERKRR